MRPFKPHAAARVDATHIVRSPQRHLQARIFLPQTLNLCSQPLQLCWAHACAQIDSAALPRDMAHTPWQRASIPVQWHACFMFGVWTATAFITHVASSWRFTSTFTGSADGCAVRVIRGASSASVHHARLLAAIPSILCIAATAAATLLIAIAAYAIHHVAAADAVHLGHMPPADGATPGRVIATFLFEAAHGTALQK